MSEIYTVVPFPKVSVRRFRAVATKLDRISRDKMPVCPEDDSDSHVEQDFLEIKGGDDVTIEANRGAVVSASDAFILECCDMLGVIKSESLNQRGALRGEDGGHVSPVRVRYIGPCEKISNIQCRAIADVLNDVTSPIGLRDEIAHGSVHF